VRRAGRPGPATEIGPRSRVKPKGTASYRETLLLVCGLIALTQASWGLVIPVLPLYARQFGATATDLGVIVSAFNVARLAINIPAGLLADRVNRRLLLIGAVAGVGLILWATSLAQSVLMLICQRFALGLAGGIAITVGQSLLADLTDAKGRGQAMATLQAFQLAGGALGPSVGGIVGGMFGVRWSYVVAGYIALTMAGWSALRLPRTVPGSEPHVSRAGGFLSLFADRSYVASCILGFTLFLVRFGGQQTLVALIAYSWAGLSATAFGVALSVMTALNLLTVGVVGRLSDRGRKRPLLLSLAMTAAGYLAFAVARSPWVFLAVLALVGLANGVSGSVPAAYCADVVPAERRGSGIGVYRTFGDAGGLVGPVCLGAVIDHAGLSLASVLVAVTVALASIAFGVLAEETVGPRATRRPTAPGSALQG
jgi:MFS family permease